MNVLRTQNIEALEKMILAYFWRTRMDQQTAVASVIAASHNHFFCAEAVRPSLQVVVLQQVCRYCAEERRTK